MAWTRAQQMACAKKSALSRLVTRLVVEHVILMVFGSARTNCAKNGTH